MLTHVFQNLKSLSSLSEFPIPFPGYKLIFYLHSQESIWKPRLIILDLSFIPLIFAPDKEIEPILTHPLD